MKEANERRNIPQPLSDMLNTLPPVQLLTVIHHCAMILCDGGMIAEVLEEVIRAERAIR